MHEDLKDIPVTERPKMVSLFPWGAPYFRAWRSLRWFLALLAPIVASAFQLWRHKHGVGVAILFGFIGAWAAATLLVTLCSGMASSNLGTHFRQTEPARYWSQTGFIGAVYLAVACLGHFV